MQGETQVILDALPVSIAQLGPDGRLQWANQRLRDVLGRSSDEIVGKTCQELEIAPRASPRFDEALSTSASQGEQVHLVELVELDEQPRLVEYRFSPGPSGEVLVVAMTNLEAQVLQDLLDHLSVLAWLRDASGRVHNLNLAYRERYALPDPRHVGPIDATEVTGPIWGHPGAARGPKTYEWREDDKVFQVVEFPLNRRSPAGAATIGGVAVDVTERRALERRLADIDRQQRLASLVTGAAHDIANDLTQLGAFVAEIETSPPGSPDFDTMSRELEEVIERTRHRLRLLQDSVWAGSPPEGRVELGALLEDVRRTWSHRVSLSVTVRHAGQPVHLRGDAVLLSSVFENLLLNADEAGASALAIIVRTLETLTPSAAVPDRSVEIVVSDDGPGIDPLLAPRLFEPFVSSKGPRRGLGLSAVAAIVEHHGGRIELEESPAGGTRFRILLPAADP